MARGGRAPVLRAEQRGGRLAYQEGQSAEHDSSHGETSRASDPCDGILVPAGRARPGPIWWQRLDPHCRREDGPQGIPGGAGPPVLRCDGGAVDCLLSPFLNANLAVEITI